MLTGCDAGSNGIPAAAAAGDINYVDALDVAAGVITLDTTAAQSTGTSIDLQLEPDITSSAAAINWLITGNGCDGDAGAEAGRVIKCTGT